MNTQKIIKFSLLFLVFILLVGIVFWGVQWFSNSLGAMLINDNIFLPGSLQTSLNNTQSSVEKIPIVNQDLLPSHNWQVEYLKIGAESAISVEIGNGQPKFLFKKNEEKKLPIASLTKLMTALVVLEQYDLNQKVTISETTMSQEGEQGNLKAGQILSVKNLLYIMLIESSNKAAYALADVMGTEQFIVLMNFDAQKISLKNTHFQDSTGLDPKSYSTAKDLAKLSEYLFENYTLFKEIINLKEYDLYLDDGTLHHKLINTNELLGINNIIGGKTGFTDSAKGCLMVIQNSPQRGDYIIHIVLGAQNRFLEIQKIINWTNLNYIKI